MPLCISARTTSMDVRSPATKNFSTSYATLTSLTMAGTSSASARRITMRSRAFDERLEPSEIGFDHPAQAAFEQTDGDEHGHVGLAAVADLHVRPGLGALH